MKDKFLILLPKLVEYILFTLTSCIIIYYLFRNMYGSPAQFKQNTENIKTLSNKMDTIYAFQKYSQETIMDLRNRQNETINLLNTNNQLLNQYNGELSNLKKVVNYKINYGNATVNGSKRVIRVQPQKNYVTLDSFFRSKYQNLKE